MNGRSHTLSRYATREAERLVCGLTLAVVLAAAALACWGESLYVSRSRQAVLVWHCLPGVLWLWLYFRAKSPRERLISRVVFAISAWTAWVGLWVPLDVLDEPVLMTVVLMAPMLGALALFARVLKRRTPQHAQSRTLTDSRYERPQGF